MRHITESINHFPNSRGPQPRPREIRVLRDRCREILTSFDKVDNGLWWWEHTATNDHQYPYPHFFGVIRGTPFAVLLHTGKQIPLPEAHQACLHDLSDARCWAIIIDGTNWSDLIDWLARQ